MEIGIVGKPNVGKSTFFEACSLSGAEIANYPFTTIKANRGMAYLRAADPGPALGVTSNPKNSFIRGSTRFVPVELLDVAGLVPDAHKGKGLGNQFLDDLRQASALVHVIDVSGSTDVEGNPVDKGSHDPRSDTAFLVNEVDQWFKGIISKDWTRLAKSSESTHMAIDKLLAEKLTGLGINIHHITMAISHIDRPDKPTRWTDEDLFSLSIELRKASKPMIIAANKADKADDGQIKDLTAHVKDAHVIPTCSEAEMALRKADKAGLISYMPGEGRFEITNASKLNDAQRKALQRIQDVLDRFGSTNVQKVLESAAYDLLDLIVVYPVEDEHKFTDKDGRVLPDAHLMKRGSNARDLAYKVHTDLGTHFIKGIDCRTRRTVGSDHELKDGDVIKVHANA
ncbi:MAG: redox-regulated ATPase YchF [Candidatus Thermoplasmatota archaeon]|nr:redox-regulated ATPase YchF [Candidatus Thermoplasmatota archaeon]